MCCLRRILTALLAASVAGCATHTSPPTNPPSRAESLRTMDPTRIQADTMGFADRLITAMTRVYDDLERRAPTPAARDTAHQLKTELAIGAVGNAVNPRPIAGLMDMLVLVRLLRQIGEDPGTAQTFGADTPGLVEALRQKEADLRAVARQYLTDPQLAEVDQLADQWHKAHPGQRSVSQFHLADMPEPNAPLKAGQKPPASIMGLLFGDPTANLDPAVREIALSRATSERMFFYLQRLPLLLFLQAETLYRNLLDASQYERLLGNLATVTASTTRFADAGSRFTDTIGRFPQQLSEERREAILQFASELGRQRDAFVSQLAAAVAAQRDAAITQATTRIASERERAIRQAASSLRLEQQDFVVSLETAADRSIDRLLIRLAVLVPASLLFFFLASVAARRFRYRPLKRPEPNGPATARSRQHWKVVPDTR
jgi:hypothetical protein